MISNQYHYFMTDLMASVGHELRAINLFCLKYILTIDEGGIIFNFYFVSSLK